MPPVSDEKPTPLKGLDHFAIAVPDTEEALRLWRDRFGFPVVHQEKVNDGTVLLTHLGLGNTQLQLVQPLASNHPLHDWLRAHGPGLHHLCFAVDDVDVAAKSVASAGLPAGEAKPHQGTQGKRALFLSRSETQNVLVEFTGK
jgi:methylmalonyl-CoA/ethylmalonyl-CoA epimerase